MSGIQTVKCKPMGASFAELRRSPVLSQCNVGSTMMVA
jgi:hypothetical protein